MLHEASPLLNVRQDGPLVSCRRPDLPPLLPLAPAPCFIPCCRAAALLLQYILALKQCHADHPIAKYWGVCTDTAKALNLCFKGEKVAKRCAAGTGVLGRGSKEGGGGRFAATAFSAAAALPSVAARAAHRSQGWLGGHLAVASLLPTMPSRCHQF